MCTRIECLLSLPSRYDCLFGVRCIVLAQSVGGDNGSVTGQGFATRPADASEKEISDIKEELVALLKDPQSDAMSHAEIQEEVNYVLESKYVGAEWEAWFKVNIEQVFDDMSASSVSNSGAWAD